MTTWFANKEELEAKNKEIRRLKEALSLAEENAIRTGVAKDRMEIMQLNAELKSMGVTFSEFKISANKTTKNLEKQVEKITMELAEAKLNHAIEMSKKDQIILKILRENKRLKERVRSYERSILDFNQSILE